MGNNIDNRLKEVLNKHNIITKKDPELFRSTWSNRMYTCTSEIGDLIIKIAVHDETISKMPYLRKECLVNEYRYFTTLKNINAPIPAIVAFDSTRQTIPYDYIIYKRSPGEDFSSLIENEQLSFHEIEAIYSKIGAALKTLHSKTVDAFGLLEMPHENNSVVKKFPFQQNSWWDVLNNLIVQCVKSMENNEYACYAPRVMQYIKTELYKFKDVVIQPTLLHGDFEPWNILIQNKNISCIVDGELSFIGDKLFDLQISFPSNFSKEKKIRLEEQFYYGYYGSKIPEIDKKIIEFYLTLKPLFKRAAVWHLISENAQIDNVPKEFLDTHRNLRLLKTHPKEICYAHQLQINKEYGLHKITTDGIECIDCVIVNHIDTINEQLFINTSKHSTLKSKIISFSDVGLMTEKNVIVNPNIFLREHNQ